MTGQTRLPTFSMNRKSSPRSSQSSSGGPDHLRFQMADGPGDDLLDAGAAAGQAAGVVVGGQVADQGGDAAAVRGAASSVFSRNAVLPAPGLDTRLTT